MNPRDEFMMIGQKELHGFGRIRVARAREPADPEVVIAQVIIAPVPQITDGPVQRRRPPEQVAAYSSKKVKKRHVGIP